MGGIGMKLVGKRAKEVRESKDYIKLYMKKDKNMSDEDIAEVHMILSMMDEAITLLNMKKRI